MEIFAVKLFDEFERGKRKKKNSFSSNERKCNNTMHLLIAKGGLSHRLKPV